MQEYICIVNVGVLHVPTGDSILFNCSVRQPWPNRSGPNRDIDVTKFQFNTGASVTQPLVLYKYVCAIETYTDVQGTSNSDTGCMDSDHLVVDRLPMANTVYRFEDLAESNSNHTLT